MDIDLRLPSGDHDKEGEEPNGVDNMLSEVKLHNGDAETGNVVDVAEEILSIEGGDVNSPTPTTFKEDTNLEPLSGMEFESHGAAYSFYQEYARSMGFNTAIQNSRRSKTSREFIDAKFACSRQTKQDPENGTSRRLCSKTDCKASMHVNSEQEITTDGPQDSLQQMVQLNLMAPTRDNYYSNQQTIQGLGQLNSIAPSHDGYYGTQQSMHGLGQMDFFRTPTGFAYSIRERRICRKKYSFDILHAVSERTRKMYVDMPRQCCGYQNSGFSEMNTQFGKGRYV
ncbi:hypothetical protein NC653_035786 [Populus alba x Populus x berolinensis]|uniref:FAR1 domain-containing protein n=1 Tax=Populus alba x Populus x berolinensis TaxID=444605 RepID=A0AAD6LKX0_9ROSI|nr:hypothetical protein NC653_035786 [Populus alba x Populus x berolinensis]